MLKDRKIKERVEGSKREKGFESDYLSQQFNLPEEQWDKDFRMAVEEKAKNNQTAIRETEAVINGEQNGLGQEVTEETPEEDRENTFNRYMNGLGLSPQQLRGARVLDLGCAQGEFVEYLIRNGITHEVYGIDINLEEFPIAGDIKDHFFAGDFQQDLPVKNFDYIVSVGAVSNAVWAGEEIQKTREIIRQSLMVIKENGEIRISPIQQVTAESQLDGIRESYNKWIEILEQMVETDAMEYRIEPRDIKVIGKDDGIVLESVLIIKRKPK